MLPPEEVLVPSDNFTITLHRGVSGQEQVSLVDPQYLPRRHGEAGSGRPDGERPGFGGPGGRVAWPLTSVAPWNTRGSEKGGEGPRLPEM